MFDARVCPYSLPILHYIVRKLNAVPATRNWLSVRLSYGMNGILLPTLYLPSLTNYLRWGSLPYFALKTSLPWVINRA